MYCLCIGGREYTMNKTPTDANDTSTSGAHIWEVFDVGSTENIKKSLSPTPGVPYSGINHSLGVSMPRTRALKLFKFFTLTQSNAFSHAQQNTPRLNS